MRSGRSPRRRAAGSAWPANIQVRRTIARSFRVLLRLVVPAGRQMRHGNKTNGPVSVRADTVGGMTPAIEAIDLVKRFGDTALERPAVDGVSFAVPPGT